MKRVIIESPFAGNVELNLGYLRAAMADCLRRGEAPFASHGLYTQSGVLDDGKPEERALGIAAGFAWRDVAELTVVYQDLGITLGMQAGTDDAKAKGRPVEMRTLPPEAMAIVAPPDDPNRCAVCAWPLADSVAEGCTRGNCSERPRPERLYAPERAAREFERAAREFEQLMKGWAP